MHKALSRAPALASSPAPVHYRVEAADTHAHLFRVTLTVAQPAGPQVLALPVWTPGSYLVREFARHLQCLQARQGRQAVALTQLDKHRWRADCQPGWPLTLRYQVYAFDGSVRAAWLDASRGFFNGACLCLSVDDQQERPHTLELVMPHARSDWQVATGLTALRVDRHGFGLYHAQDYDELVDCPVEMGAFWSDGFSVRGVPHRLVVAGAPAASFDGARLLADARRICEAAIGFWHGPRRKPPQRSYLFLLNAVEEGRGGLEHRNSCALLCSRRDLPRLSEAKPPEGYRNLLSLFSHEYFHAWNVKRLRPAGFARYRYDRENYTTLLWFFEGFTSYYDDLLLRRTGLLDDAGYLGRLTRTINQVLQTPGRAVQSVAQASFDAWIKYYRADENTPNATVSYYAKGALVALCLDLTLRLEGRSTLDAVMRALWRRCTAGARASGALTEADLAETLRTLGGRSYAQELAAWVHGTGELPLRELLQRHGVAVLDEPARPAQRLGLRVAESGGSVRIETVLRGGAAERAGLAPGDEWLSVQVRGEGWRLHRLDDLALYAGAGARRLTALVARDKRLLRLPLALPAAASAWRLALRDEAQARAWLAARD